MLPGARKHLTEFSSWHQIRACRCRMEPAQRANMTSNGNGNPPGPKGKPIVGMALDLRSDPLAGMRQMARDYGDIVRFHVMMQERTLLNHVKADEVSVVAGHLAHSGEGIAAQI